MSFVESKIDHLKSLIERARDILNGLSEGQLSQRPDPNTWSVIEVICHMSLTHGPYLQSFSNLVEKCEDGESVGKLSFIGKQIEFGAGPHANFPAVGATVPPKRVDPGVEIDRWNRIHDGLVEAFESARGKLLEGSKMKSPLMKILRINGADAMAIICAHSERHVRQMEERSKIVRG